MKKNVIIINGPNLNKTGSRRPDIYGSITFDDYLSELRSSIPDMNIDYFQSNSEGEIIDYLQSIDANVNLGIIFNPGAYSHYSYAIADALEYMEIPVVEVHISNIAAREEFRQKSVTARHAVGIISGFGLDGYRMGIEWLLKHL